MLMHLPAPTARPKQTEERRSTSKSSIRMGRTKRCRARERRNIYAGRWFTSALNAKYVNTHLSLLLPAEREQGSERWSPFMRGSSINHTGRGRIGLQPPCALHRAAPLNSPKSLSLLYQRAYFKGFATAPWWAWDESVLKSVCHLRACSYQLSHHVQLWCICAYFHVSFKVQCSPLAQYSFNCCPHVLNLAMSSRGVPLFILYTQ